MLACLVWLGGVEVLPAFHVAFHGAFGTHHHGPRAHHHDALPHDAGHHGESSGAAHEYHHPDRHHHDAAGDAQEEHGRKERPSDHGEGSLAHHDLAIEHSHPSVPPVPEALLRSEPIVERIVSLLVSSSARRTHWARGPPSSAG